MEAGSKAKLFELMLKKQTVVVPGVGEFTVQELTGADREAFESEMVNRRRLSEENGSALDLRGVKSMLIQMSFIDPSTGKPLFTKSDLSQLNQIPSRVLEVMFEAAQDVSGLGREAQEKAEGN